MDITQRFLKYVSQNTQSDPLSDTFPSSPSQLIFADLLAEEMKSIGISQVNRDENGYVYGLIPATVPDSKGATLAFLAHMDTAPDASGEAVKPRIIRKYNGKNILLNDKENLIMSPEDFPDLTKYIGQDLIVTDGTTLLGGDDKAGIAEIMTAAEYLLAHPEIPHGNVYLCFTPDEEVGKGVDYINLKKLPADFAYTVDGGEIGEIEYENFNAASVQIQITGLSIHPGSAKGKMRNASSIAMEFDQMLPRFKKPENTEGYEGFIHLTGMQGCVETASLEYIIRDHDRELFAKKKERMHKIAAYLNEKYVEGTVKLDITDSYYNMKEQIIPHMHLVENVLKVYDKLKITPKVQPIRGGTDGARLSFMGLPCPNLGTGGHNFHGPYEFVCIQSMEKSVQVLIELCKLYSTDQAFHSV